MTNRQRARLIRAALNPSGFAKNGPAKQSLRHALVAAARAHLPGSPRCIFTLHGMHAHCVELFRATWPAARIVGIERDGPAARLSKAHWYERVTPTGTEENDLLYGTLNAYVNQTSERLMRLARNGSRKRLELFDYPTFDLMFLDTTGRFDSVTSIQADAARMVELHCANPAVIGMTFVIGSPRDQPPTLAPIVERFRQRIDRSTEVIGDPTIYFTNAQMMSFTLLVSS